MLSDNLGLLQIVEVAPEIGSRSVILLSLWGQRYKFLFDFGLISRKMAIFANFFVQNYCTFKNLQYLCTEIQKLAVYEKGFVSIFRQRKRARQDCLLQNA